MEILGCMRLSLHSSTGDIGHIRSLTSKLGQSYSSGVVAVLLTGGDALSARGAEVGGNGWHAINDAGVRHEFGSAAYRTFHATKSSSRPRPACIRLCIASSAGVRLASHSMRACCAACSACARISRSTLISATGRKRFVTLAR